MTGSAHPTTTFAELEPMRAQVAPVLGVDAAGRLRAFKNGVLHIDTPLGRAFLAWLIDLVVVWGTALGLGFAMFARSTAPDAAIGASVITILLLVALPFLYGWCYRNGRALGGVLTGTRLVRLADGHRIGWAKAGWALTIRSLFMPFVVLTVLESGASGDFTSMRTSIDDDATARLWAAGFHRLS